MIKIVIGFIVFAAVALFVVIQGGDKLDMAGEAGHGVTEKHDDKAAAPAAPATSPAAPPASAAPAQK